MVLEWSRLVSGDWVDSPVLKESQCQPALLLEKKNFPKPWNDSSQFWTVFLKQVEEGGWFRLREELESRCGTEAL